jgi:aryl-alcohol dehydrogenase-like predicted oxidoreductase
VGTLRAIAARRGGDASQVALAFVLEHPFVDVVLSGAATVEQVGAHVSALGVTLDDEARGALARFVEPPARYWATRATLPWR